MTSSISSPFHARPVLCDGQVAEGGGRSGGDVLAAIFAVLMSTAMLGQTAPGLMALGIARGAAVEVGV